MDAQTHEDRRRETEAAHPIVDESMSEGAGAPTSKQFEEQIRDTAAQATALASELTNLTSAAGLRKARAQAQRILDNVDTLEAWWA